MSRSERAEAAAALERERDARLVRAHVDMEQRLVESGRLAEQAFTDAAAAGDSTAAFEAYAVLQAIRPARQQVRDRARAAEANAKTGTSVSDQMLAWYPSTFLERLQAAAEQRATVLAEQTAERLCAEAMDGVVPS